MLQELIKLLSYDGNTGEFRWLITINNRAIAGALAGCSSGKYLRIRFRGRAYAAHRLAWFIYFGYLPKIIDHINGNTKDNRISNLRETDEIGNGRNRIEHRRGQLLGVTKEARCNRWRAQFWFKGRQIYCGIYPTQELAHRAYLAKRKSLEDKV